MVTTRIAAGMGALSIAFVCLAAHARIEGRESGVAAIDLAAPPQGSLQWIAKDMRLNGVPMRLQYIQSRLQPDDLFHYYESAAAGLGIHESHRSRMGDWWILALRSRRSHVTLQLHATTAGSEGVVAITDANLPLVARMASRFPHPASTRVISVQEYNDDDVASECVALLSSRGVAAEAAAFVEVLERAGWHLLRQAPTQAHAGTVIEAQRGPQQALLTLQPDRMQPTSTAIVIIWKKT